MRGLRRSLSLSNLKTAYYYFTAPHKAKKLLLALEPDVVIGTGGYLCWPLLHAAAKLGIPTAVHESNAIPGKAVKMLEKEVDRIYINFPGTVDYLREKDKIRCVGNPLIAPPALEKSGDLKKSLKIPEYGLDRCPNIRLVEYIYDMPLWERIADVVICRAGAMTISEMALLGVACILIPSPNVVNNHQYENAKRLADAGAAILLEEKFLTPNVLYDSVCDILYHKETAQRLSKNIKSFANPEAKEEIYEDLRMLVSRDVLSLIKKKEV